MIFLGADHRGFELKEMLKKRLIDEGYEVVDLGADHLDLGDDYVDYAKRVAEAVVGDAANRGILLCGSGAGVDMVANKVDGVRSALVFDPIRARQAREHEDANVAALPSDVLDSETSWEIVKEFLQTPFSAEPRHERRLEKMEEVEKEN